MEIIYNETRETRKKKPYTAYAYGCDGLAHSSYLSPPRVGGRVLVGVWGGACRLYNKSEPIYCSSYIFIFIFIYNVIYVRLD